MNWEIGIDIYTLICIKWITNKNLLYRASLVAQWLRIRLPMQGTRVRALVREDSTCHGATKPVHHNCWACAPEPVSHNYWVRVPQLLKPVCPRACAPQQEKPLQWEARPLQWRAAPALCNSRKPVHSNEDPMQPKRKKEKNKFLKEEKKK